MKIPVNYKDLSPSERKDVREHYVEKQGGLCMWCNYELKTDPPKDITDKKIKWDKFPPNFLKHPIHLQHCHRSGLTKGAVHAYCNAVMWQYHGR